jgi:hypothetical protein
MRLEWKESPKTIFWKVHQENEDELNMCDISNAIHAKCGTAHKTGK